jgi:hypothetical protein
MRCVSIEGSQQVGYLELTGSPRSPVQDATV